MKLITSSKTYNCITAYESQQGCKNEEKGKFWNELADKRLQRTSRKQKKLPWQEILMVMLVRNEKNIIDGMEVKLLNKEMKRGR